MKLTKKQAIKLHRRLWNWLAENPGKNKEQWPEWEFNGGKVVRMIADCPACEYAHMKQGINFPCDVCPIVWPGFSCQHKKDNNIYNGLYQDWNCEDSDIYSSKRKKLALKIANLPERGKNTNGKDKH